MEWRLSHSVDLSFAFTNWLRLSASGAFVTDYLHPLVTDDTVSFVPQEPEDRRFLVATDLSLAFQPIPSLGITVGASTTYPQLAPDSSYRTPVFNRFTEIYLDLTLDVAGLVSQIQEASE